MITVQFKNLIRFSLVLSFVLNVSMFDCLGMAECTAEGCYINGLAGEQPEALCLLKELISLIVTEESDEELHSFVFFGEEGTGKTEALKAAVNEAGATLYYFSAAELGIDSQKPISQKESLELSLKIRRKFLQAVEEGVKNKKHTVICMDGIDLMGDQVDSELRILHDKLVNSKDQYVKLVVVLRDVNKLDPGVRTRSIRVEFDLPDRKKRFEILKYHVKKTGQQIPYHTLQFFASITQGFSGKDLKNLIAHVKEQENVSFPVWKAYLHTAANNPKISSIPRKNAKKAIVSTAVLASMAYMLIRFARPKNILRGGKKSQSEAVNHNQGQKNNVKE